VEFFLGFYDLLKEDLLKVVKESQASGRIFGPLNKTFLAFIPKKSKPVSFDDFHPISCCNLNYKLNQNHCE
jgi:hypothetical protein